MPRISNSVWPGPIDLIDTPGVPAAMSLKLVMPRAARSAPLIAVMLIAVLSADAERFCAVTTISVTPPLCACAPVCAPVCAWAAAPETNAITITLAAVPSRAAITDLQIITKLSP